jgi:hypothetical protein
MAEEVRERSCGIKRCESGWRRGKLQPQTSIAMAASLARDAPAEKSSALGLAAFDTHPTLPHVSIFSLIAFYTNLIYSASDQNENKMKNEAAIRTVSIACSKTPLVESLAADAPSRKQFRRVDYSSGSKGWSPRALRRGMQLRRHAVIRHR